MKNLFEKFCLLFQEPRLFFSLLKVRVNRLFLKKTFINGRMYYYYKGEYYPEYLNRGNAVSFVKDEALKYCRGKGIDVGAGQWPLYGAIPVREEEKLNAYKLDIFPDGSLDYVFSSHCVEHLEDWKRAVSLWIKKLKIGGVLFIYAPHKSMLLWRRGAPWVGLDHKWSPEAEVLEKFISSCGCEIILSQKDRDIYWSFRVIAVKKGAKSL
ncbi:MAG: hypothetical protein Fur0012_08600 [Elusimicrobiota bacterium]